MAIKDEILCIANQLANEGKKPTVALVKPKLSSPTPLPLIISTLKNWQHQPDNVLPPKKITLEQTSTAPESLALEHALEKALAPIKQELKEVKALLATLTKNNN